jgi:hypothetical protein
MMVDHETVQSFNNLPTSSGDNSSLVYWEGANDNLTEIMKNIIKHSISKTGSSTNTSSNTGAKGTNTNTKNTNPPSQQNQPKNKNTPDLMGKLFFLVSCQLSFKHTGILKSSGGNNANDSYSQNNPLLNPLVTSVPVPTLSNQRSQMVKELESSSSTTAAAASSSKNENKNSSSSVTTNPLRVIIARNRYSEGETKTTTTTTPIPIATSTSSVFSFPAGLKPTEQSLLYAIPLEYCDQCLYLDFLALCVSHVPYTNTASPSPNKKEGGGGETSLIMKQQKPYQILKHLEAKLLALTLPTSQTDEAAHILTNFEQQAEDEMRRYIERLMEGLNENDAEDLQDMDKDIHTREATMRLGIKFFSVSFSFFC